VLARRYPYDIFRQEMLAFVERDILGSIAYFRVSIFNLYLSRGPAKVGRHPLAELSKDSKTMKATLSVRTSNLLRPPHRGAIWRL